MKQFEGKLIHFPVTKLAYASSKIRDILNYCKKFYHKKVHEWLQMHYMHVLYINVEVYCSQNERKYILILYYIHFLGIFLDLDKCAIFLDLGKGAVYNKYYNKYLKIQVLIMDSTLIENCMQ